MSHAVDHAQQPSKDKRHYGLCAREGRPRMAWKIRDEGVALDADQLYWTISGRRKTAALADIISIRLQVAYVHRSGTIANCMIEFRTARS